VSPEQRDAVVAVDALLKALKTSAQAAHRVLPVGPARIEIARALALLDDVAEAVGEARERVAR
jgi:hypothetical protein